MRSFCVSTTACSLRWVTILSGATILSWVTILSRVTIILLLSVDVARAAAAEDGQSASNAITPTVRVVDTQPIPGIGVAADQLPTAVSSVSSGQLGSDHAATIADSLQRNLGAASIIEAQGSPYQATLNYRAFSLSSNIGEPQGISVYLDGMRLNDPFSDGMGWDIIPGEALSSATMIPGAQPTFGLNTLGGALLLKSKSGADAPGTRLDLGGVSSSGSKGGYQISHGQQWGTLQAYGVANYESMNGWRDSTPSDIRQGFMRLDKDWGATQGSLSVIAANSDFSHNGLSPLSQLQNRWSSVYTSPDNSHSRMDAINLGASHWLDTQRLLSFNIYHQNHGRRSNSGDVEEVHDADDTGATLNGLTLKQQITGLAAQMSQSMGEHHTTFGVHLDHGTSRFDQTAQAYQWDHNRNAVDAGHPANEVNKLRVTRADAALYAVERWQVVPSTVLQFSAQWQWTRLKLEDQLHDAPPNLDGNHIFAKLNPAIGVTYAVLPAMSLFGNFGQTSRAPTPVELGCADSANPCTLPNSLAADPPLKQVVAHTVEGGLRGDDRYFGRWSVGAYASRLTDDILFVSTGQATGYFTNYGHTWRQGLEAQSDWALGPWKVTASYALTRATFGSDAAIASPDNSHAGENGLDDHDIQVKKGDTIPGIARHRLTLSVGRAWGGLTASVQGTMQSWSYVRGNENNEEDVLPGKTPGFAVFDADLTWRLPKNFVLSLGVNNIFDTRYYTVGQLGTNAFNPDNSFIRDDDDWRKETFYAPGAPRLFYLKLGALF